MLTRTITPQELDTVLSHYNAGLLTSPAELGGGTANANMTLETANGKYFLKRRNPKYANLGFVAFDHRLMEYLAPFQLGTPLAVQTSTKERWLVLGETVYELYPYQKGNNHDPASLEQLASAGSRLASFHRATRHFPTIAGKEWQRYHSPTGIRGGLEALSSEIKQRLSVADYTYLQEQTSLLERDFPDSRYHALPKLVVHGDYHPGNLKFLEDHVSGVFDLDWATVQPRILDLADGVFLFAGERASEIDATDIVSLTQTWTPSEHRTRAFLEAYLQHEQMTEDEWGVMELAIRARWLHCRIGGMAKLPEKHRVTYLLEGLLEPLRALHSLNPLFLSLRKPAKR